MGAYYDKFEYIKQNSLGTLVSELSLISNIVYNAIEDHSHDYKESIKKAQKISEGIGNIKDLNNYYLFLRNEIDEREKISLKSYEIIQRLKNKLPELLKL